MTKTEKTIEKHLSKLWDLAAAKGDQAALETLRTAFEGNGLGYGPILVRQLTATQAWRLQDADSIDYPTILAAGPTWVLIGNADNLSDLSERVACPYHLEETQDAAIINVNSDLTDTQISFIERSIEKSLKTLSKKLRAAERKHAST